MNIKEFIDSEKQDLQTRFRLFNERGSVLTVYESGVSEPMKTAVDGFVVTRVAPFFDAEGNHVRTEFWLLWKALGYVNDAQFCHTIKVVSIRIADSIEDSLDGKKQIIWLEADLTDDLNRHHHIEVIEPGQEPDLANDWRDWLSFKNTNIEAIKKADEQILYEHLRIAEEWQ